MSIRSSRTSGTSVQVRVAGGRCLCENRSRAFTLVEALVVLGILILIGGLALPGMTRWSSRFTDSAFEGQVQNAIDSARAIAISNGVAVKIKIDHKVGEGDRLSAVWQAPSDREESAADRYKMLCELAGSFSLSFGESDPSISDSDGSKTVWTVLPDGSVSETAKVSVRRGDGATASISVGVWNGKVALGAFVSEERAWYDSSAEDPERPSSSPDVKGESPKDPEP